MEKSDLKAILSDYAEMYDENDDQNAWFEKLKALSDKYGYASDMKAYKENPQNFKGSVTDISTAVRVALAGRRNSPDMFEIMHTLGKDRTVNRIKSAAESL